ncbi:hypothetical protein BC826DRAFT_1027337 [Russula brevipes]|nr:hypothetical protein BC826DRAFT_1027337 [Russula brevipes]
MPISAIIQDIHRMKSSGLASLAFFYCDFRDDQKKGRRGLLSSLLVQLCDQSDAFLLGHGHGKHHASDGELVKCPHDMISSPGQATAFIVIDGLDGCPMTTGLPSPRDQVLELVKELVDLHIPNLRICITSRPEVDIVPILHPLAFRSISLHHESGQLEDIAEYVRQGAQELVISVLTSKADGMFRWVFCQLAYLRHCLPGRIRRALDELPKTLDETYERVLKDIGEQNWEFAHRLFHCVAAASRPLRVEELAEFLAFDFDAGSTPMLLADWRPKDPGQAVLSTCSSLLAVVNVDGLPIIQFAHFSVKEYLTSKRLADTDDTISRFHVSMTPAHTIVAQGCLGALLHLDDKDTTRDSLETFPLLEYLQSTGWGMHSSRVCDYVLQRTDRACR